MPPAILEALPALRTPTPVDTQSDLIETHVVGTRTTERRVSRHSCPMLWDNGINVAGMSDASDQFTFVRWNPHFLQILISFSGKGEVLIDRKWQTMHPGWAYVTPAGQLHAYHTAPGESLWQVGWIVLPKSSPSPFPIAPDKPQLLQTDPELVHATLMGLFCESVGKSDPAMLENWARLTRLLAARITGSTPRDEVIDMLWKKVATRLAHSWTLAELAGTLGCSEEHLRRLCQRRYGCSPRKRLLSLRMQHAASLLSGTQLTIAAIAEQVGYENEFAFSNAFKRWSHGVPPSIYRRRALSPA